MTTPIVDFVRRYAQSGTARLHMPGHKGQSLLGCEPWDITEIRGADELYEAEGIIAQSEANATRLFGTAHTYYSTEGSSQCIRAMLCLALQGAPRTGKRPVLLAARNAHKALLYAAALLDFDIRWLWPAPEDTGALLILLVLLAAVGILWKRLHREPSPNTAQQGPTILQQELTGSEWNTISYTPARRLNVQTLDNGMTAMDFRLAAQTASPAVERSSFSDVSFLGDSLTQGMQLYDTGLPNAHFCAYKGVGPNAVVNNTTCRRADGEKEIPMEALASQQPRALYVLLGTNVLTADNDYSSFLTYYRLMLDMISQALPNTKIYVQSITPVRPEVSQKSPGLYKQRLCEINDALSAIALEKGCTFLNLWEALADENGDLIAEYAQPDGYHLLPAGYDAWVEYLCTHT